MSIIDIPRNLGNVVEANKTSFKTQAEAKLDKFAIEHLVPKAPFVLDRVPIDYHPGFNDRYQQLIQEGYYPVLYLNHQSHPDGPVASRIIRRLIMLTNEARPNEPIKGFKMLVTITMGDGKQGPVVKAGEEQFDDYMVKNGVTTLKAARTKDQKMGASADNHAVMKELLAAPGDNFGVAIFPEGGMEDGRRALVNGKRVGHRDQINGLQEPPEGFLARIYQSLSHHGKNKIMYIPAGVFGGYRILDPENSRPTLSAALAAFGLVNPAGLMMANVGMPETTTEIQEKFGTSLKRENVFKVSTHLMGNLKPLLPSQAWGVFK
jgi:hypothetical protein